MTKKIFNLSLLLLIGAILTGCDTYGLHAKRGTAIGGNTGAVIGAVASHQNEKEEEIRRHRAFELDLLRDDEWEPEFAPL